MVIGIGVDITENVRFEKWLNNPNLIQRFFNEEEIAGQVISRELLASRFAAKEAFVKALGTGFKGLSLKNIWVTKDEQGRPQLVITNEVLDSFEKKGGRTIHISLSHEKEYSIAFVVIEG